ncbi:ubiquitin carboxyl-terminal hydrolase 2-like [Babylonia areolata]|uniref:ubiquitin carboxyl-terminal hydrolase 2-like n=1 Tax=Babylonia areolata TaxID=304850 RepID=UPI003FD5BAF1
MPIASGGLRGGNYATVSRTSVPSSLSIHSRSHSATRTAPGLGGRAYVTSSPHNSSTSLQPLKTSRPLPVGPGPLDRHGNKLEGFSLGRESSSSSSSSSSSRLRVAQPLRAEGLAGKSATRAGGPLKADHSAAVTTNGLSKHSTPEYTSSSSLKKAAANLRSGRDLDPRHRDPSFISSTIGSGLSGRRSSSLASLRIGDTTTTTAPPPGSSTHHHPSHPATAARYDIDGRVRRSSSSRRKSQVEDSSLGVGVGGAGARQSLGGEVRSRKGSGGSSGGGGGSRYSARFSTQESSPGTSGGVRGEGGRHEGGGGGVHHQLDSSSSRISSHSSSSSSSQNSKGSERDGGKIGLRNLGNTCFMNSVLQCLSNTRPLLEWCLNNDYTADINTTTSSMKGGLVKAFASLMKSLWRESSPESYVSPNTFKTQIQKFAPRFMGYSQQDSQEFLRYLLEGIHEDVNRIKVKPKPSSLDYNRLDKKNDRDKAKEYWNAYLTRDSSHIVDIFVGQLKSELKFVDCGHRSVTFDPFWDLSLPIPKSGSDQSLDNCLRLFMKEEELEAEERPMCAKCKMRRSCTKSFSIQRFPRILVFHLKRFSQERYGRKLNSLVDFPVKGLDLSDYSSEGGQKVTYDLYAVSNHSGSVHSGHYTAMCRNPYTGEWHTFNDTRVSGARCNQAVSSEAYLLFYELTSPTKRS